MIKQYFTGALTTLLFCYSFSVCAQQTLPENTIELRIELDRINFELKDDIRDERLALMVDHMNKLAEQHSQNPEYLMLAGFFNIQYASNTGGLGALKYAKAARNYLNQSIAIDPTIYGASAHAVLGRIYTSIPGWPLAFGDKKKGEMNMLKAIEISPDGMDSNITYASYLLEEKQFSKARHYLLKAQQSPARPNREKADEELHKLINEKLKEIEHTR